MTIGIDVRHLARGPLAGVGIVTRELLWALAQATPENAIRIFYNGRSAPPAFLQNLKQERSNATLLARHGSNRFFDLRTAFLGRPKIDRLLSRIDVLLSPHTLLAPVERIPRVLVIHDLSFVAHPEFFSPKSRRWHRLMNIRGQVRRAKKIIVPSKATARDLQRFWNIPEEKIVVVPWAVPRWQPTTNNQRPTTWRTVLFLGTVEKRKNVLGLVRAFDLLKKDPGLDDVRLVIAGAPGWGNQEVRRAIAASPCSNVIEWHGYVDETEKHELLANANLFVYPSFYEGFGLPVLEAMAAGVPVITSAKTSLPEVAGNAAILIDPNRQEEIAEGMRTVLTHRDLAVEISRRGRERVAQFRWETTAQMILNVLREAVDAEK